MPDSAYVHNMNTIPYGSKNSWGDIWLPWITKEGQHGSAYFDVNDLISKGQSQAATSPGQVSVVVEVKNYRLGM